MKKNNKGFTLVELLASMTILALIMALVVPNVLKIKDSNMKQGYVDDANKLVDLAKYEMAKHKKYKLTEENSCNVFGLGYLDNSEFDNPPNEGCYDVNSSYVIVKYYQHEYHYYVRLIEAYPKDSNDINTSKLFGGIGYNGALEETNDISKKTISKGDVSLEQTTRKLSFNYQNIGNFGGDSSVSCASYGNIKLGVEYKEYSDKMLKEVNGEIKPNSEGICAIK